MNQQKPSKFNVIELLKPPYLELDKHVCIPNSWVVLRDTTSDRALVKFPIEKLSETKKRVKNEENFSKNWPNVLANVKYSTDSYEHANEFIKIMDGLDKMFVEEEKKSDEVENDLHSEKSSISSKEILEVLEGSETNEVPIDQGLPNNVEDPMNNQQISLQSKLTPSEVEVSGGNIGIGDAGDSIQKTKRYLTRQSSKISSRANDLKSLDQNKTDTQKKTITSEVKQNNNRAPEADLTSELTSELETLAALQSLFNDNFKEKLNKHYCEFDNSQKFIHNLQICALNKCMILQKLIDQTNNCDKNIYESGVLQIILGDNYSELWKQLRSDFEEEYTLLDNLRKHFQKHSMLLKKLFVIAEQISKYDKSIHSVTNR